MVKYSYTNGKSGVLFPQNKDRGEGHLAQLYRRFCRGFFGGRGGTDCVFCGGGHGVYDLLREAGDFVRLDKYLGGAGVASRSEATKYIRHADVTVNGIFVRDPSRHIDPETAIVTLRGERVVWKKFLYVMLHKPKGYVSATEDRGPTVMELLPPSFVRMGLFPCGRLDIDTEGFLLITNDGALGHALLSPKHHVDKVYRFACEPPIGEAERAALTRGVDIGDCVTKPAELTLFGGVPAREGTITIREGKFHQIKRMFHAVGSEITALARVSFGGVELDETLSKGAWRYLTAEEEDTLRKMAGAARTKDGNTTKTENID